MASAYGTVTATNSAGLLRAANYDRRELRIVNFANSVTIYIGQDSSVTSSNGYPLYPNQNFIQSRDRGTYLGDIYVITASGTADVRYWEVEGG